MGWNEVIVDRPSSTSPPRFALVYRNLFSCACFTSSSSRSFFYQKPISSMTYKSFLGEKNRNFPIGIQKKQFDPQNSFRQPYLVSRGSQKTTPKKKQSQRPDQPKQNGRKQQRRQPAQNSKNTRQPSWTHDVYHKELQSKFRATSNQKPEHLTEPVEALLRTVVSKNFDKSKSFLKLHNLRGKLEELNKSVEVNLCSVEIWNNLINVCAKLCPQVTTLSLSHNNLSSLSLFVNLKSSLPHLINLDLSSNNISQFEELSFLKALELRELVIFSNPLQNIIPRASSFETYCAKVQVHLPTLQYLDTQEVTIFPQLQTSRINRRELLETFGVETGMKPNFTLDCLEKNNWDYLRALADFRQLKVLINSAHPSGTL